MIKAFFTGLLLVGVTLAMSSCSSFPSLTGNPATDVPAVANAIGSANASAQQTKATIAKITAADLQAIAQEFFKTESVAVTALGNLSGLKISRDQLTC